MLKIFSKSTWIFGQINLQICAKFQSILSSKNKNPPIPYQIPRICYKISSYRKFLCSKNRLTQCAPFNEHSHSKFLLKKILLWKVLYAVQKAIKVKISPTKKSSSKTRFFSKLTYFCKKPSKNSLEQFYAKIFKP